uniref:TDP43_N domain-containing protein n=1 Tax=Angiostrongylus cantonensis TaxID=6313 RepID=A0A158P5R5_ANGCA
MYYRSDEAECRSAVKFDGKRFLPPGGAWSDRRYYVTTGQRCHAFSQPFGSYENASKQFERSVTAVQKMLGSSLFAITIAFQELPRTSSTRKRVDQASPESTAQFKAAIEPIDPSKCIQDGDQRPQDSIRKLSPIEQQFADLAKISTGKDVIIEQQRGEIRRTNDLLQNAEKSSSLALKCEAVTENCAELSEQLQMAIISRDLLTNELASLRPLANAIDINNADGVMAYLNAKDNARRHQAEAARAKAVAHEVQCRFDELNDLQTTVIQENTRLIQRNAELEEHASNFESELQKLDERWKVLLQKEKHEWEEARKELEAECTSMKKQLVDLQDVLAAVTRDATENSRRAAELQKSRDELKQHLEAVAYKAQLRAESHASGTHHI